MGLCCIKEGESILESITKSNRFPRPRKKWNKNDTDTESQETL